MVDLFAQGCCPGMKQQSAVQEWKGNGIRYHDDC